MISSVNPGRWLRIVGSFELHGTHALDIDTRDEVTLARLLRSFGYDPSEKLTGRVQITIEPYAQGGNELSDLRDGEIVMIESRLFRLNADDPSEPELLPVSDG